VSATRLGEAEAIGRCLDRAYRISRRDDIWTASVKVCKGYDAGLTTNRDFHLAISGDLQLDHKWRLSHGHGLVNANFDSSSLPPNRIIGPSNRF
jgi:hypothetical protein